MSQAALAEWTFTGDVFTNKLDSEGNFVYFRQTNSGSDGSYAYEITLENVNGITSIDNPITIGSQTTE